MIFFLPKKYAVNVVKNPSIKQKSVIEIFREVRTEFFWGMSRKKFSSFAENPDRPKNTVYRITKKIETFSSPFFCCK